MILAIGILAGIAFLVWRKRKQSKNVTSERFMANDPGYQAPQMASQNQGGGGGGIDDQPVLKGRR